MIQKNTKNTSFLKMARILRDLGIKNYTFFLELYDEGLYNIDPLSENLSKEMKVRVHNEIKKNPWYFLREIVRIPTAGEKRMFELTRATLAICWGILNNISSFVVLPRQCYKTYTICAMYTWMFYWGCENTEFMLFSYADSILQGNLARIKEIRETFPPYLNLYDTATDKDNSREMKYVTENFYNHLRIKAPSKSKEDASKVGRGFSTPCMWFDELNFIPQIGEMYDSSSFAYKTVADIAKKNGSHYHRIMSSSVGRLDDESGQWGFNFLNGCCNFTEIMYDLPIEQVKEMIFTNSTNQFLRIEYMYYDLGKPDTYLEEMKKDSTSEDAFQREVLNRWAKTGGTHPLGKYLVDRLAEEIHEPKDVIVIDKVYFLKLYKKKDEIDYDKPYICGVDTGGNLTRDFSTFVITDPTNFEVIGVMRSNQFSTTRFVKGIATVMQCLFLKSIAVIERNYVGITVCDGLIENYGLSRRVYCSEDGKPGFATTNKTRPLLYNVILRIAVTNQYKLIHDTSIINEVIALTITRQGRIDHPVGGHDDTLMGYLFTRWFLMYAKNISRYIDPSIIGTQIKDDENKIDQEKTKQTAVSSEVFKHLIYDNAYGNEKANYYNLDVDDSNQNIEKRIDDTMNNIENKLYNSRSGYSVNIEVLDNKDVIMENEDENFDAIPDKLADKVKSSNKTIEKHNNFIFDRNSFNTFLRTM